MHKTKSSGNKSFSFILTAAILFILSVNANSQMKYDVKLLINEKVLFKNCVKDGSDLFISIDELALKIDGSVSIEGTYKLGPYFKFKDSKVSLIKTGAGTNAELKVNKKGVLSTEVKIIILEGKDHAFIHIESFVAALGGTWAYDENTGIYGVTVGGCGACLISETGD